MNGIFASGPTKQAYGFPCAAAWSISGPKSLVPPVGIVSAEIKPGNRIARKSSRAADESAPS